MAVSPVTNQYKCHLAVAYLQTFPISVVTPWQWSWKTQPDAMTKLLIPQHHWPVNAQG